VEVRPGQKWRDVRGGGTSANVITIERVEGSTAHGHYNPEDAPTAVGTSAWSVDDVSNSMTLIEDPEWPAHRVAIDCRYGDENVDSAMGLVGQKGGASSMSPRPDGVTTAIAWWDVVAPTESDAVDRARDALRGFGPEFVDLDSIHVDNTVGNRV
jgi:hypothetical protein